MKTLPPKCHPRSSRPILAALIVILPAAPLSADLIHRWSFDDPASGAPSGTVLADSISGLSATVRGHGATFDGNALVLPGDTDGNQSADDISAYLDLPNGVFSSKTNLTLEIWATPVEAGWWSRLFNIGRVSGAGSGGGAPGEIIDQPGVQPGGTTVFDCLEMSLTRDGNLNAQRLRAIVGGIDNPLSTDLPTTAGTRYNYVLTFEDGAGTFGASGGRVTWYRDGVPAATSDVDFRLSDVQDVNNWLGRSGFTVDQNASVSYDEVRIYSHALTPGEIAANFDAGPDLPPDFPPPVANSDSATLHPGQKILIDVLSNDTGGISPDSVEIVTPPSSGTATVQASGRVLYAHDNSGTAPDQFTYRVSNPAGQSEPAVVEINLSTSLRITNADLAMPPAPPQNAWTLVDALPGLTFNQPIVISSIPGDANRLFVGERLAHVQLIPDVASPAPSKQVFLNLHEVVQGRTPNETVGGGPFGENGLLGLAFHPDYAENGYFFVAYTVRFNSTDYQRISRFQVSADPDVADPASELVLLQQLDRVANHNGGDLHFGPDGYLYYTAGDEGDQRDAWQNSQKINLNFFAGILRIDVDKRSGNLEPNPHPAIPTDDGIARFSVPIDNPFVHTSLGGDWDGFYNGIEITDLAAVRSEFWATGLRHPWRMSFDPETGDLWAGDVGQDTYEEVNKIVRGGNYGWVFRDGARDSNFSTPPKPPGFTSTDPVYEYLHTSVSGGTAELKGNSVVGGYVYRGGRHPSLHGDYIFSDSVSGHVWQLDAATAQATRLTGLPG